MIKYLIKFLIKHLIKYLIKYSIMYLIGLKQWLLDFPGVLAGRIRPVRTLGFSQDEFVPREHFEFPRALAGRIRSVRTLGFSQGEFVPREPLNSYRNSRRTNSYRENL